MSSIHTGAVSARRYRCPIDLPEGFRDDYAERLANLGFRESESPPDNLMRIGWVQTPDMFDSSFSDLNQWYLDGYLMFTMRIDTWKIPGMLLKAHMKRRVDAWLKEHSRVRCPASVRSEIRDLIQHELVQKVLPKTELIEIVWRLNDEIVMVGTQVESKNDLVRKLFFETFDACLLIWNPLDHMGVDGAVADKLQIATHYDFAGPEAGIVEVKEWLKTESSDDINMVQDRSDDDAPRIFNPWLVSEFMVYLWFTCLANGGSMEVTWTRVMNDLLRTCNDIPVDLWIKNRITFSGGRKDLDGTASVKSESAAEDYVAMSALADQRLPESVCFGLLIEEREYDFVLTATPWMDLKAVKLPATVGSDFETSFYDRMLTMQELEGALDALWQGFCVLRASSEGWRGQVTAMRSWIQQAVDF